MNVKTLKSNLKSIVNDGNEMTPINFIDQDGDSYLITDCYLDDDGDICLEAGEIEGPEYSASDLLYSLRGYHGNTYVYVYCVFDDLICDIKRGWYIDDDYSVCMDMYYN